MPFKKLSRRTFLTASSALAFLHTPFARAIPARQSVNINDYNPHDWIASFKQAFSEGQTVVVPAGLVCDNINTGIFIPAGKTLHILGSLRGNGRGRFVLQDGSKVTGGEGGSIHNITLDVRIWNKKVKILVTGGAGFIGSAVVRHIINNTQDSVVNVDKLTYAGNLESLAEISDSERYSFEHADICDAEAMARIFAQHQPDAVMHLAAESHVDRSITGPAAFIETNIVGTYVLLEAARNYWSGLDDEKKKNFRFHHISTDEVYGDLPHPDEVNSNETLPLFTETTAYAPSSPYSASKASSDHLVRAWKRTYGLPTIVTNCSNNYGPYHFPEKLIPLVILNALEGKALPIYGKGDQIRDWLYVEDHARALYTVVTEGKAGETYNIGGHNEKKNIDVVFTICDLLDEIVPKEKSYREQITYVADRPGHDRRYAIDADKISRELGWKPQETFESGIRKTVEWYLANTNWVENVKSGAYQSWIEQNYEGRH